jgi:peptidoglycan/xylan/chitin deacetylase (PgdA/CDA1 family)
LQQLLAGREPSVLLYHETPRQTILDGVYRWDGESLERQLVCLKRHFDFIYPRDIATPGSYWYRKPLLLTFDDGFRNNACVVAPLLRKHKIPAVFFVSCGHIGTDRLLWFAYLSVLEQAFVDKGFTFRGEYFDMSPGHRKATVARLRAQLLSLEPHPAAMYSAIESELPPWDSFLSRERMEDWYAGMTEEQPEELAADELFSVQGHTCDHPFLTQCTPDEAMRQIEDNKRNIERICKNKVTTISYPSGDYDQVTIRICRAAGMHLGYAVIPRRLHDPDFEIPRAGIYQRYPEVAGCKAMWARRRSSRG